MHIWDTVDKEGIDLTWEDVEKEIANVREREGILCLHTPKLAQQSHS